jgi:hypothetical protein
LSRRTARFRAAIVAALAVTLAGCDDSDSLQPDSSNPLEITLNDPALDPLSADEETPIPEETTTLDVGTLGTPTLASASYAGGIPFGTFALPTTWFGDRYNGAMQNNAPNLLRSQLEGIKSRGGKVILMFAGNERYYKDGSGNFSLTKWKERINRYKGVNFDSYISDGTIIGHYLIDEPNDPANWSGRPVTPSTLEEMARYSKSLWPSMTTIVRVEPSYLSGSHRYLDAAWAQYLSRRGDASDYIRKVVGEAQSRGLGLVVGMNVLRGGTPNGSKMTASEVQDWGSKLLSSTYPCAFISWTYNSDYLSGSSIKSAMDVLRNKAESRSSKTCRGG